MKKPTTIIRKIRIARLDGTVDVIPVPVTIEPTRTITITVSRDDDGRPPRRLPLRLVP